MAENWRKPMFSDLDDTSLLKAYMKKFRQEGTVREIMPSSYRKTDEKPAKYAKVTGYRKVK